MKRQPLIDFELLKINRDLLLEFFLVFAKFEYALKNSNFAKPVHSNEEAVIPAEPDWGRFALSIHNLFDRTQTSDLAQACEYMFINPPLRQVLVNGRLGWEGGGLKPSLTDTERLLVLVRRVRNNLFHGGKFSNEVFENTERHERLVRSSLLILEESLRASPNIKAAFDIAVI
jgi:hypothetical protein